MKMLYVLLITISLTSCGGGKPSIETMVKKYMTDSVVIKFNDPKSYEYVSMSKPDSISNHMVVLERKGKLLEDITEQTHKKQSNKLQMISDKLESTGTTLDKQISDGGKKIDSLITDHISYINKNIEYCDKQLLIPDSLNHLKIKVSYRGKNKMGALILDELDLKYYPKENRFIEVQKD